MSELTLEERSDRLEADGDGVLVVDIHHETDDWYVPDGISDECDATNCAAE